MKTIEEEIKTMPINFNIELRQKQFQEGGKMERNQVKITASIGYEQQILATETYSAENLIGEHQLEEMTLNVIRRIKKKLEETAHLTINDPNKVIRYTLEDINKFNQNERNP